ncbi:MAG: hypothetical protein WDN04_20855 [Rhodospirillales bacterium]
MTVTVQATTDHAVGPAIEALLGELSHDRAVLGTSWKVVRATPEA